MALALGCAKPAQFQPVTIFAAASTAECIDELSSEFEHRSGSQVKSNYAGSSTLAHQIEEGAPADVFLSASDHWADYLDERGLVAQRKNLLGNRLVVVTSADSKLDIKTLDDLAGDEVKHLAVADESVPAGAYGRQALQKAGLWEKVEGKVVGAADVREALMLVERGEAQAGIVYFTDTLVSSKVRAAVDIRSNLHDPIRYPLVLLKSAASNAAATRFYEELQTPKAAEVFEKRGFTVNDER
jgi:molybdate transport system substrate-binding protein